MLQRTWDIKRIIPIFLLLKSVKPTVTYIKIGLQLLLNESKIFA